MQDTSDLLDLAGPSSESAGSASDSPAHASPDYASQRTEAGETEGAEGAVTRSRRPRTVGGSLAARTLADLQGMAAAAGITGTAKLRKAELIQALQGAQGSFPATGEGTASAASSAEPSNGASTNGASNGHANGVGSHGVGSNGSQASAGGSASAGYGETQSASRSDSYAGEGAAANGSAGDSNAGDSFGNAGDGNGRPERSPRDRESRAERLERQRERQAQANASNGQAERPQGDRQQNDRERPQGDRQQNDRDRPQSDRDRQQGDRQQGDRPRRDGQARDGQQRDGQARDNQGRDNQGRDNQARDQQGPRDDDDDRPGRRGRYRDRRNRNGRNRDGLPGGDAEPVVNDDDVLVPVAGIVDILDSYAFVRTSGYLSGPNDVYVSLAQVRRYGLRRGDAVTGSVKQPRDGGTTNTGDVKRDKFNALVKLETVNGLSPEEAGKRPEFGKLIPLYPQERLRLETEPHILTTRVIDLVLPIGKGQRALIVSPPKAGKTTIMQDIANAITTNNPECHLMVVLVDERPEEVTDMQRSVKGEVIASTFDRPPTDHITVAELSIERAKRLVEMGHDVVVLLDNITRLGRAYNLGAPASGRILTGGVDAAALYQPKRFLGAARNIENGGSLTIMATALVETGSAMDGVFFEEYKGTGNAELKLDRGLANKRVFPAIDIDASGTRKEELLMARDELRIVLQLRRVLHALEGSGGMELLLEKLKETKSNTEFLLQIQKTMPGAE